MVALEVSAKSFPPSLWGTDSRELRQNPVSLTEFATPLVSLDQGAIDHNTAVLADWAAEAGVALCPHGKTSMTPALWRKMLDAGAWGITVATAWQAQVAAANEVPRVMIANEVTDGPSLDWVCAQRDIELYLWIDSLIGLQLIEQREPATPINVVVDVGGIGGRAGVRADEDVLELANAAASSSAVRLAGIGGYEGALAHTRGDEDIETVRRYCACLVQLYGEIEKLFEVDAPIITASGSAYYDVIAQSLAPAAATAQIVLRPGSYQVHDSGHFRRVSPFGQDSKGLKLISALDGWATVLSRPEPNLVLLDGGRRDFGFDIDLPQIDPDDPRLNGPAQSFEINDQHLFVRIDPSSTLAVGDRVHLDLSHPCTSLDKWRFIPMVLDGQVVDVVETWF